MRETILVSSATSYLNFNSIYVDASEISGFYKPSDSAIRGWLPLLMKIYGGLRMSFSLEGELAGPILTLFVGELDL